MSATDHFSIDDFYYREISELTEAGGWSIDFENKKSFFDNQARKILNVPENYTPTLKTGYRFYDLIKNYNISFDAVMFKKEYSDKLDEGFDEKYNFIHDLDIIIRLSYICEINYTHQLLSYWRMHEGSDSYLKMNIISREKRQFIKKISKQFSKDKLFKNSKVFFIKNILYEELIHNLINNKKKNSIKKILKLNGYKKTLFLLPFVYIPFGTYIFKKIYLNFKFKL